ATIPVGVSNSFSDPLGMNRPPKVQMMMRTLLAERFKLVVHRESRDVPVYALTVGRGGAKLPPSTDASCGSPDDVMKDFRSACGASAINVAAPDSASVRTWKMSLDDFSRILIVALDRPVINRTELTGGYDIYLEFAPDRGILQSLPVGAGLAMTGPVAYRGA